MRFAMIPLRRRTALRRWRRGMAAAACALALAAALGGAARAQALTEAQLRARFLVNFLRFTEWPDAASFSAGAPLDLCLLGGGDSLDGALGDLQGQMAAGHKIQVHSHVRADQAGGCRLLYVPDSELRRLAGAREAIGERPVLIVGESEAVLDRGGMIALRNTDRHLGFVVNLGPARRASLSFAPQMLHAAVEVLP